MTVRRYMDEKGTVERHSVKYEVEVVVNVIDNVIILAWRFRTLQDLV